MKRPISEAGTPDPKVQKLNHFLRTSKTPRAVPQREENDSLQTQVPADTWLANSIDNKPVQSQAEATDTFSSTQRTVAASLTQKEQPDLVAQPAETLVKECQIVAQEPGEHVGDYANDAAASILAPVAANDLNFDMVTYGDFHKPESEDDEVCFGMIKETSLSNFHCPQLSLARIHAFDLSLKEDNIIYISQTGFQLGSLEPTKFEALQKLKQDRRITLQLRCIIQRTFTQYNKKTKEPVEDISFTFFCNIYGPLRSFDKVGDFLEGSDICLQDPQGCDRNVRYRNPHRLNGRDDDAPMTIDKFLGTNDVLAQDWKGSPSYLDELEMIDHKTLPLADEPSALKTTLFEHQRRALYFMQNREHGWNLTGEQPDIWKSKSICNHTMYLNTINDELQVERPPQFKGGVVADAMGLGKTLEIISLITSDLDQPVDPSLITATSESVQHGNGETRCTLIIVPPQLLSVWEQQIQLHCDQGRILLFKHHKQQKLRIVSDLFGYNVVLTTYDTVSQEFKRLRTHPSVLYMVQWHRIVLDEGHWIRTQGTQREEAIFELKANRRWVVTGTPIQNHISDLTSLLQFLRVHPYDETKQFERDILKIGRDDPAGFKARLQRLIAYITIRRTSRTIELPDRDDQIRTLRFSKAEQDLYDAVDARVAPLRGFSARSDGREAGSKQHVLQGLHQLRAVCNFGVLADTTFNGSSSMGAMWDSVTAQNIFNDLVLEGSAYCLGCKCNIAAMVGAAVRQSMHTNLHTDGDVLISRCARTLCMSCKQKRTRRSPGKDLTLCSCEPRCDILPVFTNKVDPDLRPGLALTLENRPTKIKYLIRDLDASRNSKSVVFSQWRATLNLVAVALDEANIAFVRYDGHVVPKERELALERFANDLSIQVVLFTIQCGAEGLNLTAASRAYLMEPHWNPTVEEQALARIYRVGQEKPVTTIRFIIGQTYEQEIAAKQQAKKDFSDLLLSTRPSANRQGVGGDFAQWRSVPSEYVALG